MKIDQVILELRDQWLEFEPRQGPSVSWKTIVIVLMGIPSDSIANVTNTIHQRIKPFFLEKGLMFGEFFANNKKPGLRNADFHTLQSPLPLLVIRDMLPMDIVFLAEKPEFFQMYKLKFGPHFPKEILDQLGNLNKRFTDPYTVHATQYLTALNASNDQKSWEGSSRRITE